MKIKFIAYLLILFTFLSTTSVYAESLEVKITKKFDSKNLTKVKLKNDNGSLFIKGTNDSIVRVNAFKYLEAENKRDAEAAMEDLKVHFEEKDGVLEIWVEKPKTFSWSILNYLFGGIKNSGVYFEVYLPENLAIEARTVNGKMDLRKVAGNVECSVVNGDIRAYGVEHNANFKSVNGTIKIIIDQNHGTEINAKTVNGKIYIDVNPEVSFDFNAATVNGAIKTDYNVNLLKKGILKDLSVKNLDGKLKINVKTVNGKVVLSQL
ncbi:MAG: hypothetical protein Kow00108_01280 [Calditrichia bacterium]